jgi:hypothetical protein
MVEKEQPVVSSSGAAQRGEDMDHMSAETECNVAVAVHIRPLIGQETFQGCVDVLQVTPGMQQVRPRWVGSDSFL